MKKTISEHIIITLLNTSDKEKILKQPDKKDIHKRNKDNDNRLLIKNKAR